MSLALHNQGGAMNNASVIAQALLVALLIIFELVRR